MPFHPEAKLVLPGCAGGMRPARASGRYERMRLQRLAFSWARYRRLQSSAWPAYYDTCNDKPRVYEEGHEHFARSRRQKKFRSAICWILFVFFAFTGGFGVYEVRRRWNLDAEIVHGIMRRMAVDSNLTCVSTRDIGVQDKDWLLVVNGKAERLMASPQIVNLSGDRLYIKEEASHCPTPVVKTVRRMTFAQVNYDVPSFDDFVLRRRVTEPLTGDAAICVQHAADVFLNRWPCEQLTSALDSDSKIHVEL